MHHIVYKITNRIDGKYYIGVHTTENIHDGYMGSGYRIKSAIKKEGITNFSKQILFDFETRIEALAKEAELVSKKTLKDEKCYNLFIGGGAVPTFTVPARFDEAYKWVFKTQKESFDSWIKYLNAVVDSDPNGDNELISIQKRLLPQTDVIWSNLMNDLTNKFNSKRRNNSAMKLLRILHKKNLLDCLYVDQIPWETA